MSWAAWARVLAAVSVLPLGGLGARAAVGLALGAVLAGLAPPAPPFTPLILLGEVALGATLGLIAGLPAHAARALGVGAPAGSSLGTLGHALAWGVFFGAGGFVAWMSGLGHSLAALPAGAWPEVADVVRAGDSLLYAIILLGLPVWLIDLCLGALTAWLERAGGDGRTVVGAARPMAVVLAIAAMLPLLLDVLRATWFDAVRGG